MKRLAGLVLLLSSATPAVGQGPTHHWQFGSEHLQNNAFKPLAGSLAAPVRGPIRFGAERPKALLLDGNARARHGLHVAPDLKKAGLPARDLTVEAWVLVERPHQWGGIAGAFQHNGGYQKGWVLGFNHNQFSFAVSAGSSTRLTYLKAPTAFQTGFWYHVVGTYDGQQQRLYVDGELRATAREQSGAIAYPPRTFFTLGAYHDDNEHHTLAGALESVAVFARALSADEVAARFRARKDRFPDMETYRPTAVDWPTYQRDPLRTGMTDAKLPWPLRLQWVHKARHPPAPSWPEEAKHDYWHQKYNLPEVVTYDKVFHVVGVGDRVYFGSSAEDRLYCLDAASGRERWSFATEGPVRLAPTVHEDRVLFGSDDGHVYCLAARDGALLWKQRLGPEPRRLPGNGRLISAWPVRTGVLVEEGKAYFCSGVFPSQGVYQGTLDVRDGKLLEKQQVTVTAQGYPERRGGKLHVATGRVTAGAFVAKLKRLGREVGKEVNDLPKDYPHAFIGAGDVRIGGGDGKLAAFRAKDGAKLWSATVEGQVHSLAVVRGRLLASTDRGHIYCFGAGEGDRQTVTPTPLATPTYPDERAKARYAEAAEWALKQAGVQRGYALVLGSAEGRLVYELATRSEMQVIGVEPDAGKVAAARAMLHAAGLSGRIAIHHGELDRLPYTDYLFNLIVSDAFATGGAMPGRRDEVLRVLRPHGGVALFGRGAKEIVRRGALEGEGEWTHMYADAGNTACSGDTRVAGELQLQWFGAPGARPMIDRHHRTVAPLYKAGRLFVPGEDRVIAVDAYNGTILWDRAFARSRRVIAFRDCSYLALADTHLYVAAADRCLALDPQTGVQQHVFTLPVQDGVKREWGYLAHHGDLLVASAVKHGSSRRDQSLQIDRTETYYDFVPVVCSDYLFALDRPGGKLRWTYRPQAGLIPNPTLALGDGMVYFLESKDPETRKKPIGRAKVAELFGKGAELVALDLGTGKAAWRRAVDLGAAQHIVHLACARGKVVVTGSRNSGTDKKKAKVLYDVQVFDARTGAPRWSKTQNQNVPIGGDHGEQDQHPVIVGDRLYCEPFAYDLHTGQALEWKWPWVGRRRSGCGNISASASMFFFRNETVGGFDLTSGEARKVTTETRPGCWINLIPAGGLLLAPEASSGCTCGFSVQTSLALIPRPRK
jgi:outer membrane protein assembly factor BamB